MPQKEQIDDYTNTYNNVKGSPTDSRDGNYLELMEAEREGKRLAKENIKKIRKEIKEL